MGSSYRRPILVVDDDPHVLGAFRTFIEAAELTTLGLTDSLHAMEVVETHEIDIVVTDYRMPFLDGIELTKRLKEAETRLGRTIYVLMITAYSDSTLAVSALKAGAFCYLTKPVQPMALVLHIRRAINEVSPGAGDGIELKPYRRKPAVSEPMANTAAETPLNRLPGLHYPLDEQTILADSLHVPGVVTLRNSKGDVLAVEWCDDMGGALRQWLQRARGAADDETRARYFEALHAGTADVVAKIFDKVVNDSGGFPLLQKEAPPGSKYAGKAAPRAGEASEFDGIVTSYRSAGDQEMVDTVRVLLEKQPDNKDLQDWYAFVLYTNGRTEKAAEVYETLISGGSQKPDHYFYLGNAYHKLGRFGEAIDAWKITVALAPESEIGRKAARRAQEAETEQV